MNKLLPSSLALLAGCLIGSAALAKLPPLSDEAKAKAAEASAKTAHGNKVADYKLCQSMDSVAARYFAANKKERKDVPAPTPTPACADPGPFVYPPPAAAAPGAAPAAAPAATAGKTAAAPKK
ncbi:MAG: hypothetical protein JNJ71_15190 [Rubrivivax sp.]|nr:hypothetical protein [Rubrivivax sp.]